MFTYREELERIEKIGVIPVITIDEPEKAPDVARALAEGGLPVAEITLRTGSALESIRRIAAECPDMLVGAGTVLGPIQALEAAAAGARFIVSPCFNKNVARWCVAHHVSFIPGCFTPSEIDAALALKITVVKLFPAEQAGGPGYIKALAGPFGHVRFIPTGGVTRETIGSYRALQSVLACGCSWIADSESVRAGDFPRITRNAREAVRAAQRPPVVSDAESGNAGAAGSFQKNPSESGESG
ncbi:MAG: bifunctional 4-hydroxy-2-oxoglutarate aldolase/2-dehydro-3-deoxy-phosphogluconate aldolase [Spirochaetaceae bacterium]|jgi:2-dehydro-3-deoxyphosphogluconate aldolase/(4S)-4-hydroxy-2-oxoglutarate aldolase|nr:bifunctional 4-hydroxy-2-oxoglutarate aldolase/2-dehydro-3-deoxy-phosphogluconate aldolase [Spirochaetaceae bacterium]